MLWSLTQIDYYIDQYIVRRTVPEIAAIFFFLLPQKAMSQDAFKTCFQDTAPFADRLSPRVLVGDGL